MAEEMKLGSPESTRFLDDLADGDHFAGMPSEDPVPCPVRTCNVEGLNGPEALNDHLNNEHTLEERRSLIINEISDEIDSGDAHLMTRNELVEFMQWWVDQKGVFNANSMIYEATENNPKVTLDAEQVKTLAKQFFIEKGYE